MSDTVSDTVKVRLVDIAHARSGDKGDTANVGIIAYEERWYPFLERHVSDVQVVLAKFTGSMIFFLLTWSPLLACVFIVRHFSNDPNVFDTGTLLSTFLGIALLGGLFISMGCFASSLTRSQIVAAMFSFALGISLFLLSFLSYAMTGQTGWLEKLFAQLSLIEHMRDFARGVVDSRAIIFDLSLTGLFLFLTHRSIESRRWKS